MGIGSIRPPFNCVYDLKVPGKSINYLDKNAPDLDYNGDRRDKTSSNYNNNRRTDEDGQRNKNGWRNNDREFNVRRQDFGNNNNRGSNDNNSDRGSGGDRDSSSCEVRPQQYSVSGYFNIICFSSFNTPNADTII